MDRWQAQYNFWSQFGVPAYEENSVPDLKELTFPYITYEAAVGGFGDTIPISASIWDKVRDGYSALETLDTLSDAIEDVIVNSFPRNYDNGKYRVWKEGSWSENMSDPDDDKIKRKRLSVNFEFMDFNR